MSGGKKKEKGFYFNDKKAVIYIYMSGYSIWAHSKIKIVNKSLLNKQLAIFYQPFITEYIYIYIDFIHSRLLKILTHSKIYMHMYRYIYIYIYIYLKQAGLHKWQNLIGLENLKISGFHFHGTMKLFTKVFLAIFCESP